jgi:hypothetical protein
MVFFSHKPLKEMVVCDFCMHSVEHGGFTKRAALPPPA